MAPSNISIVFLFLNERRFLFSSANVTFNEALIETLNAYLNARLNERPHEEGYYITSSHFSVLHFRLTRLVEVYDYKAGMTLISELATGGELLDVITSNKYVTEIEVARIVQQMLESPYQLKA